MSAPEFHILDEENFVLYPRLLIKNRGFTSAKSVQVIVTDVYTLQPNGDYVFRFFVPIALRWTHIETPICTLIPGRSYRLINLGRYEDVSVSKGSTQRFTFWTEVTPKDGYTTLVDGSYIVRLSVTAANRRPATVLLGLKVGPSIVVKDDFRIYPVPYYDASKVDDLDKRLETQELRSGVLG